MSTPRQQLEQIMRTAQHLHETWGNFREMNTALATTSSDHLGIRGGDHCDPVYAGVLGNQTYSEVAASIAEALGVLTEAERKVTGVVRQHPETTRDVDAALRAARCSDPVCTDNAVKDGLCFTHWNQKRTA